eukprot:533554-Amphidinium_carterae.1
MWLTTELLGFTQDLCNLRNLLGLERGEDADDSVDTIIDVQRLNGHFSKKRRSVCRDLLEKHQG